MSQRDTVCMQPGNVDNAANVAETRLNLTLVWQNDSQHNEMDRLGIAGCLFGVHVERHDHCIAIASGNIYTQDK